MDRNRLISFTTVAVLVLIWGIAGNALSMPIWISFITWATFFAMGAEVKGLHRLAPSLAAGIVLGILSGELIGLLAPHLGTITGPVISAITAFLIMALSLIPIFSFAAGMFVGWSVFAGSGSDLMATLVCVAAGLILSYLSVTVPGWFPGKDVRQSNQSST